MKYLVLKRVEGDIWERVGAVDVALDALEDMLPEQAAVQLSAREGGTYAAIPFDNWVILEAEARIEVRPVPILAPEREVLGAPEPERDFAEEHGGDDVHVRGGREEWDGMERPRQ